LNIFNSRLMVIFKCRNVQRPVKANIVFVMNVVVLATLSPLSGL